MEIKYVIERIKSQKNPVRFLLSRILWLTRVSSFFTIYFCHGIKMKFYPTSTSTALWVDPNCFNSEGVNFIWDYLRDGDTFVDVGANIGHLTLIGAKKVGNGKVISIEPHPRTFNFLNKNIKLNKFNNVATYNFAAGEKKGKDAFSSIRSDDQNFVGKGDLLVEIGRIDDMPIEGPVELLKVDVEGYELFVLKGGTEVLAKTSVVYCEVYETNFTRYNYHLKDIINLFKKNNFRVFKFTGENKLKEIDEGYMTEECENLVAIKDINHFRQRVNKIEFDFLPTINSAI